MNYLQKGLKLRKKYLYDSIYRMDGILKPSEIYGEALTVGLSFLT